MKSVIVKQFGGPQVLDVREEPTPKPGRGQALVRLTSIGMNHADLMARRGEYRLASGDPPFTPGLEGGGVIEAVGEGVEGWQPGHRVILSPDYPRPIAGPHGGTYRSHALAEPAQLVPAPDAIPDDQLGAIWLPYLTAWGCLVWKQHLDEGQSVAIPAASSSVGLAAAQVVKHVGGVAIGLTTRQSKADALAKLDTSEFDHVIVTHEDDGRMRPWHRDVRERTDGRGVDVCFDPVAAGAYLDAELRCLAQGGTIWVYGLLGKPDVLDVSPLIRLQASIRGWILYELVQAGERAWRSACERILAAFAEGRFRQQVGGRYALDDAQRAHAEMEEGDHVGKLVLVP